MAPSKRKGDKPAGIDAYLSDAFQALLSPPKPVEKPQPVHKSPFQNVFPFLWCELSYATDYEAAEAKLCMVADLLQVKRRAILSSPAILWTNVPHTVVARIANLLRAHEEVTDDRILKVISAYLGSKDRFSVVKSSIIYVTEIQLKKRLQQPAYARHHVRMQFLLKHLSRQSLVCICNNLTSFKPDQGPKITLDALPIEIIMRIVGHVRHIAKQEALEADNLFANMGVSLMEGRPPPRRKKPVSTLQSLMLVNKSFNQLTSPMYWQGITLQSVSNRALVRLSNFSRITQHIREVDANTTEGFEDFLPPLARADLVDERIQLTIDVLGTMTNLQKLALNFMSDLTDEQEEQMYQLAEQWRDTLQDLRLCCHPANPDDMDFNVAPLGGFLETCESLYSVAIHMGELPDDVRMDGEREYEDAELLYSLVRMKKLHSLNLHQFCSLHWTSFREFQEMRTQHLSEEYEDYEDDDGDEYDDDDDEFPEADSEPTCDCSACAHARRRAPIPRSLSNTGAVKTLHHLTLRELDISFSLMAEFLNLFPNLSTLAIEDTPKLPSMPWTSSDYRTCKLDQLLNLRLDSFSEAHETMRTMPGLWLLFKDTKIYSLTVGYVTELKPRSLMALLQAKRPPLSHLKALEFLDYSHLTCCEVRETMDATEKLGIETRWTSDAEAFHELLERLQDEGKIPAKLCAHESMANWDKRRCRFWEGD